MQLISEHDTIDKVINTPCSLSDHSILSAQEPRNLSPMDRYRWFYLINGDIYSTISSLYWVYVQIVSRQGKSILLFCNRQIRSSRKHCRKMKVIHASRAQALRKVQPMEQATQIQFGNLDPVMSSDLQKLGRVNCATRTAIFI